MRPMDRIVIIGWIAVAHFVASVVVFFWWGSVGWQNFDTGVPHPLEAPLLVVHKVLRFPLVLLAERRSFHGLSPAFVLPANSVIWGLCVFAFGTIVHRCINARRKV